MTEGKRIVPALPTGGQVSAIIPQSVEEVFRLAKGVVQSKLAPFSLVKGKNPEDAAASVAIVMMAGAELGLPPMVSLRSFTVIGGRPALYGDGIITVVRKAKVDGKPIAKMLKTGFTPGKNAEFGDDAYGWCIAIRSDTGEESEYRFSVADAKRAGLWDDRAKAPNRDGTMGDNEAPWHRYPQRMLPWRAAGYLCRELFGDILGGMTDEYEAREIARSEGTFTEGPSSGPPSTDAIAPEFTEADIEPPMDDAVLLKVRESTLEVLENMFAAAEDMEGIDKAEALGVKMLKDDPDGYETMMELRRGRIAQLNSAAMSVEDTAEPDLDLDETGETKNE